MVMTLTGPNSLLIQQKLQELVDAFQQEHGEGIERFDGNELETPDLLLDAVRSVSFLEPRKLVVVKNFGQHKGLLEKIEDIVGQTADSTDLILIDSKLDKRTSAYKFLQKHTDMQTFIELSPADLKSWISKRARDYGKQMSAANAQLLLDRTGHNQLMLDNELKKLSLTSGQEITREAIEMLIEPTPQSKVFSLLEALFRGDLARTMELYRDQRAQGEEPQKITAMITWQLQQLVLAVYAPQKTTALLVEAGMSPYSAQKALDLGRHISPLQLKRYINELAELDAQSKTSADMESTLAVYFSEVATEQATSS